MTQAASTSEIEAAFEKIAANRDFARSERLVSLLDYVISKTLAGEGDRLKAFTIGLDVFGIEADADPEKSAIVRVEMGRLRKKLEHYYLTDGARDPIVIAIPKGNYRPVFTPRPPQQIGSDESKSWKVLIAIAASLLVLLLGSVLISKFLRSDLADNRPTAPIVEISLFKNYSGLKKMDHVAAGLSFDIVSELARFSWLAVYVDQREGSRQRQANTAQQDKKAVVPDYTLAGSVNVTNDRIIVAYRLSDARSGIVKWSKTFDRALTVQDIYNMQGETAKAIAIEVGQPEGIVKRLEQQRYRDKPANLSSYVCTLTTYRYWRTFSAEDHRKSRACLEQTVVDDPGFAEAQAALAFIYLDEVRYEKNPRTGYDALERSSQAAERAVKLDPFSTLAKQALFTVKLFKGDLDGFEEVGRQALGLSPNNPELLADFGGKLALFAAKWEPGLNYARRALSLNADPAPWYFVVFGYRAILDEDDEQALKWAERMNSPMWLHYQVIRLISFARLKNKEKVRETITAMEKIGIKSVDDAIRRMEKWGGHKSLRLVLNAQLKAAFIYAGGES